MNGHVLLYYLPNTVILYYNTAVKPPCIEDAAALISTRRLWRLAWTMTNTAPDWDDERPIYRQLMDKIVARIIDQTYPEGELLPSVRQLASDAMVNPLTAARAYRELGDLTETRRGVGLIVKAGVRDLLLIQERKKFLQEEWPVLRERIETLDIDLEELLKP